MPSLRNCKTNSHENLRHLFHRVGPNLGLVLYISAVCVPLLCYVDFPCCHVSPGAVSTELLDLSTRLRAQRCPDKSSNLLGRLLCHQSLFRSASHSEAMGAWTWCHSAVKACHLTEVGNTNTTISCVIPEGAVCEIAKEAHLRARLVLRELLGALLSNMAVQDNPYCSNYIHIKAFKRLISQLMAMSS